MKMKKSLAEKGTKESHYTRKRLNAIEEKRKRKLFFNCLSALRGNVPRNCHRHCSRGYCKHCEHNGTRRKPHLVENDSSFKLLLVRLFPENLHFYRIKVDICSICLSVKEYFVAKSSLEIEWKYYDTFHRSTYVRQLTLLQGLLDSTNMHKNTRLRRTTYSSTTWKYPPSWQHVFTAMPILIEIYALFSLLVVPWNVWDNREIRRQLERQALRLFYIYCGFWNINGITRDQCCSFTNINCLDEKWTNLPADT